MKSVGLLFVLSSAVFYSLVSVLIKKANQNIQPFTVMAISMLVLFLLSFFASVFFEESLKLDFNMNRTAILILIAVGTLNFIGFWLAIKAFPYMPLWLQQMFGLLNPILAGVFAFMILKEPVSWKMFIGLIVMAAGLFIAVV